MRFYPKFKRIVIELTHQCNIKCNFCYLLSSCYFIKSQIHFNDIVKFIESLNYKTHFFLTGGEPLLYPKIAEVLKTIKYLGHEVGINTNGSIINKNLWNKIASSQLDYVIFSLSNINKNSKNLIQNIKFFNSIKNKTTESIISTVVLPENLKQIIKIYDIAIETKTDRLILEHLQYYDNFLDKNKKNIIMKKSRINNFNFKLYIKTLSKILNSKSKIKVDIREPLMPQHIKSYYTKDISISDLNCSNYTKFIIIQPNGTIRLCTIYPDVIGNIFNFNPTEIIKKKINFFNKGLPHYCYRCCHRFNLKRIKTNI